jgi:hypothetical protein
MRQNLHRRVSGIVLAFIAVFLMVDPCRGSDLPTCRLIGGLQFVSAKEKSVVVIMKRSIRNREIKEFSYDQTLRWKVGQREVLDGIRYRTGLVTFRAETIFGVKNLTAKAYIQSNRVAKWVWPRSGLEIQ